MDYLVHLVKLYKNEVDETLQSDPILKTEIEYDLKMYEKRVHTKTTTVEEAVAVITKQIANETNSNSGTVVKPSLRKSLGGLESRHRTPFDSLKRSGVKRCCYYYFLL